MVLISDLEERIKTMGLKEAYNFIISEDDVPNHVYNQIRFGFMSPKIDIYDYLNKTIQVKGKTGQVLYRGHGFRVEEIYTDMEKRLQIMKKFLLKKYKRVPGVGSR